MHVEEDCFEKQGSHMTCVPSAPYFFNQILPVAFFFES